MAKAKKIDERQRAAKEIKTHVVDAFAARWTPEHHQRYMRRHAQQIRDSASRFPAECAHAARDVLEAADELDRVLADDACGKDHAAAQGIVMALEYARMLEARWVGARFTSVLWRGTWLHDLTRQDAALLAKLDTADSVPTDELMPLNADSIKARNALRKHRATLNKKLRAAGVPYEIQGGRHHITVAPRD